MGLKNSIFTAITICALSLALVGCANFKDDDGMGAVVSGVPDKLYTSFESLVVRTSVQDGEYIHWSEGDEIAYLPGKECAVRYRLQSGTEGIFERISTGAVEGVALDYNYGVYPYAEDIDITNEGSIVTVLKNVQPYAADSFGQGAALMVARADKQSSAPLQFRSAMGFLKLQLYAEDMVIKRVELRGNNGEQLSGKVRVSCGEDGTPKTKIVEGESKILTVDCGDGVRLATTSADATEVWFAIPEQSFSAGFAVTIYDAEGTPHIKTTSRSFNIERNSVQPMKAFDVQNDSNIDIEVEDGMVLFYLATRGDGVRSLDALAVKDWSAYKVLVNGQQYSISLDSAGLPYIRVAYNENAVYNAVLYTEGAQSKFSSFPYGATMVPCSQFESASLANIAASPLYATYTKKTGRTLVFNDSFALLHLRLRGDAKISSVRAEAPTCYTVAGAVSQVPVTGGYTVADGANFVALNCVNKGSYAPLSKSVPRDFYLMVASGNYIAGFNISVCDTNRRADFYEIERITLAPGDIYTIDEQYAPSDDMVFYDGFDNCVWGGDIVRGRSGIGFAPDNSTVGVSTNLDRTGYEEALTQVAYNIVGSAFVQPNDWNAVSSVTVDDAHQVSASYVESRQFNGTKYLYRVQEHPGYIAIGTATTSRGIYRSPMFYNVEGIGSLKVKIRFALQAGYKGVLQTMFYNGGRFVSASLDGKAISLDSNTYKYEGVVSTVRLPNTLFQVASSAADEKVWHTLELEVADVADGSRLEISDEIVGSSIQGIYLDCIEIHQLNQWLRKSTTLRVLLWNIQNGMWADQHNNYDNFVEWVNRWDPDICIWCESETIYKDKTNSTTSNKYLPDNWSEVSKRYGHNYVAVGGNRDNYPQTVTSKYPITVVQRITNTNISGKPVSHGAGHFTITVNGKRINVVSLHMWPQSYGYGVATADRPESTANNEGDKYRAHEMQYIVDYTVGNSTYAAEEYWIFGGDTNARSRLDNWYLGYDTGSTKLLTHDIVLNQTDLKDVIAHRYPGSMMSSTYGSARIDILYASPAMYNMIDNSTTIIDRWLSEAKKSEYYSSFYNPSDHRPILVDFDLSK